MYVHHDLFIRPRRAMEGHEQQPPRIERSHHRGRCTEPIGVSSYAAAGCKGRFENAVLGEKSGEGWYPRQRQGANPHQGIGKGDHAPGAAHLAHVLLVGHGVDHRARAKEQERLEKGVGQEMEDAGRIGRDTAGEEHITELAARGIGYHPLDVVLHETDRSGEEGG